MKTLVTKLLFTLLLSLYSFLNVQSNELPIIPYQSSNSYSLYQLNLAEFSNTTSWDLHYSALSHIDFNQELYDHSYFTTLNSYELQDIYRDSLHNITSKKFKTLLLMQITLREAQLRKNYLEQKRLLTSVEQENIRNKLMYLRQLIRLLNQKIELWLVHEMSQPKALHKLSEFMIITNQNDSFFSFINTNVLHPQNAVFSSLDVRANHSFLNFNIYQLMLINALSQNENTQRQEIFDLFTVLTLSDAKTNIYGSFLIPQNLGLNNQLQQTLEKELQTYMSINNSKNLVRNYLDSLVMYSLEQQNESEKLAQLISFDQRVHQTKKYDVENFNNNYNYNLKSCLNFLSQL